MRPSCTPATGAPRRRAATRTTSATVCEAPSSSAASVLSSNKLAAPRVRSTHDLQLEDAAGHTGRVSPYTRRSSETDRPERGGRIGRAQPPPESPHASGPATYSRADPTTRGRLGQRFRQPRWARHRPQADHVPALGQRLPERRDAGNHRARVAAPHCGPGLRLLGGDPTEGRRGHRGGARPGRLLRAGARLVADTTRVAG